MTSSMNDDNDNNIIASRSHITIHIGTLEVVTAVAALSFRNYFTV